MAINEAQILQQLEAQDIGKNPEEVYTNILTELSDEIVDKFKEVIRNESKGSGTLAQSVTAIPSSNGFEIEADYYFKFIDEGVSGTGQDYSNPDRSLKRPVVKNSPYRFKHLGVSREFAHSIREWSGASIERSYMIAIEIKRYGIRPKGIIEKALDDATLEKISEDLATITGLAVEATFNRATKD
jgi:hypothetical protein